MDKLDRSRRSWNMSRIRSEGMKPEMLVRRMVHGMGYRYRLHRRDLPGKPDLVFPSQRKIILVHGCFWHQHPDPDCPIRRTPKSNTEYWNAKLKRNAERDELQLHALRELGWKVLACWECETRDLASLKKRLRRFLG